MIREFRDFLMKGNIVDLAVAFIAGAAFSAVVQSLVDDVILQLVAAVVGRPDFSELSFSINDSTIRYGAFLTVLVNFVLTMAGVFFLVVKPVNAVTDKLVPPAAADGPAKRECTYCLAEVPGKAQRCQFCTSELQPVS